MQRDKVLKEVVVIWQCVAVYTAGAVACKLKHAVHNNAHTMMYRCVQLRIQERLQIPKVTPSSYQQQMALISPHKEFMKRHKMASPLHSTHTQQSII